MDSRIIELASQILASTKHVDDYLSSNGLPRPSFDEGGPSNLNIKSDEVEQARFAAINASQELLDLLQGPEVYMKPFLIGTSLEAIHKWDIARKVPVGGEISFKDLAARCDLWEPDLKRILRFAMTYHHLFREPSPGVVAHSLASRMLAEDQVARDGLGVVARHFHRSFTRTVDAVSQFGSQEPSKAGFCLAHDTEEPFFQYISSRPEVASMFAGFMKSASKSIPGNLPSYLVGGYAWDSLGDSTIVDVAGSEGHISFAIAEKFPRLKFVVQDLPDVAERAKASPKATEFRDRISFQGHNFFEPQPVAADAYLFRWIFHDWPDKYVIKILRQLVPALKPGAKIIINEGFSQPHGSLPPVIERTLRQVDMVMLAVHNSREREVDEWKEILKEADPRFGAIKFSVPEKSVLGIIEATWEG